MNYELGYTDEALADIERHRKSRNKPVLKKIRQLLSELKAHPRTGTGRVERLKYYEEETWSRRISREHRIIYQIFEDKAEVIVLSAHGHYDD